MTMDFYKNGDTVNTIGKSLSKIQTLSGYLRDDCNIDSPVIMIQAQTPLDANYMYIPEFKRYYFIDGTSTGINNLTTVYGSVDALESFKDDILRQTAIIERQENLYNLYLNDPIFRVEQQTHTQFINFQNGFLTTPTILVTTV